MQKHHGKNERPGSQPEANIPQPDMAVIAELQNGIVRRFAEIQQAKAEGKPVVFSSVLIPREILQAMDVAVIYGNVVGAHASIFGLSGKYCQQAENMGLSRDVCSMTRCTVGVACGSDREPFFDLAFAEPDLVIGSTFPCTTESKSLVHVAKQYGCPYYIVDAPMNTWGREIPDHAIGYYVSELRGMIDFLKKSGYALDEEKLSEAVAFTKRLNFLLREIDEYKKAVPLPIRSYDSLIASIVPIALPKELLTVETFERLRDELKERVESGFSVVENERLRLLWIGVPPLSDFKLLNYPEKHGAVVAKSMIEFLTGFDHDPALIDPEKPLASIARAHLMNPINPASASWLDYFVKTVRDFKIDGVISVVQRSCSMIPCLQRMTKEAIYRESGIPTLVFDLDGLDSRDYDEAAVKASIDSFIETLLVKKGGGHEHD
jgi:benzoyl-CoA reductase/2-hydroxyglutaryl-CoA dehydratase subunit BcrC/BadD/HgdB